MISWHANNKEPYKKAAIANDALVALVDHNTASIKTRLDALATCDGTNENVDTLIKQVGALGWGYRMKLCVCVCGRVGEWVGVTWLHL